MSKTFKIGDHVSWNSEAGRVSGTIIAIHTEDFTTRDILTAPRRTIRSTR